MTNNVEVIYEYKENPYDYTFSYTAKDGTRYVYCSTCKKFERMDAVVAFDESTRPNYSFRFEYYRNDRIDTHEVFKRTFRYYTHKRLNEVYDHGDNRSYLKNKKTYADRLYKEVHCFICPTCGSKYARNKVLYFETKQQHDMCYRYGVQVLKEPGKNGMMVKLIVLYIEYGVWNDHLIIKRFREKITFNADTGYTYMLKKKYFTINRVPKGAPMKNISYMNEMTLSSLLHSEKPEYEDAYHALYNALYAEKERVLGHKPDGYDKELSVNDLANRRIHYLSLLNRFPNIPFHMSARFITEVEAYGCFISNKKVRKVNMREDDWAKTFAEAYQLEPTKFVKRLIRSGKHPQYIKAIKTAFNEPNNVAKLVNSAYSDMTQDVFESDFIKDTIALCGETGAANKLINDARNIHYLRDTINMYKRAKEVLGKYDIRGTIMEVHDKLSADYRKLQNANVAIKHEEKAYALECFNDKYDLTFAKDTHELIDIGATMHICVGSYGDSALSKRCNIMVVRNKKGHPLVCIELSGDYKNIKQAKYFGNGRLPKEEYNFVMNWAKEHKFKTDIYDLAGPANAPKRIDEFNVYMPVAPVVHIAN